MVAKVLARSPNQTACIHKIHELGDIAYPDLLRTLNSMIRKNLIIRVPDFQDDRQYALLSDGKMTSDQFVPERLSPLIGLTEQTMRDRVIMLKRMKSRLIIDWHPIIDVILRDYERDIGRVEGNREPPEADEPDVLDRDF